MEMFLFEADPLAVEIISEVDLSATGVDLSAMEFVFEVNPSAITLGSLIAIIYAAIIFIGVPALLAVLQYRLTQKQIMHGLCLLLGTFASALLLGIYSLFVGVLLLIIFGVSSFTRNMASRAKSPQ